MGASRAGLLVSAGRLRQGRQPQHRVGWLLGARRCRHAEEAAGAHRHVRRATGAADVGELFCAATARARARRGAARGRALAPGRWTDRRGERGGSGTALAARELPDRLRGGEWRWWRALGCDRASLIRDAALAG